MNEIARAIPQEVARLPEAPVWARTGKYSAFVRNAFLGMLAYRLRYYTGILTYLLFVSVHYFIWSAVFASHAVGTRINGFTLPEMVTYVSVGWMARSLYFSTVDEDINELVRSGQISIYLIRPVNFHLMMLVQAAGETLFRLLFFSLPIGAVIVVVFPVSLPATAADFGYFLLATVFSFIILAEINFIVGLSAFYFSAIDGIMRAKYFLVQLLSGLLLPLTFFPGWARAVLDVLPFKLIAYVPLQVYLGKVPENALLSLFLTTAAWSVALVVLAQFFWRRAVRKLTLQGG